MDISYIYIIVILNISDHVFNNYIYRITVEDFPVYFFIFTLINCIIHAICLYILIGSRLLLLITLRNEMNGNNNDLKDFVPMSTKQQYKILMNKLKVLTSNAILKSNNDDIQSDSYQVCFSVSGCGQASSFNA